MTLDPHAKRFLDMMAMSGAAAPSIPERRVGMASLARLSAARAAPPPVTAEDLTIPGPGGPLPARLYRPLGAESGAGLLFLHGGGLVTGDLDTHDALCRALCAAASCRIVAVAYRLAPEHPFPAALEDACAAAAWVGAHAAELGIDPARLAVGGDSAGGGLAAVVCQQARANGPAIAAQLLLCPVLDPAGDGPSRSAFATGYGLDAATIVRDFAALGGATCDPDDPRIAPLRERDLAGLPPTLVHTAEYDIVRDDGTAYAERLAAAGVPVRLTCHTGQIHFFYGLAGLIPAGRKALEVIGRELAETLG